MRLICGLELKGSRNVPSDGGLIIASNHVAAGDPPLLGSACPREVHFMAKKELFKPPLGLLIKRLNAFPVDREGFDLDSIKNSLELLRLGHVLLMFPEGTRSRDGRLGEPKPGVAMIALKAGVPIVPVFIANTRRAWLNRLSGKRLLVHFGEPMNFRNDDDRQSRDRYREIAAEVMRKIECLKEAAGESVSLDERKMAPINLRPSDIKN